MVGETARSSYRKKKKGKLFSGTQRHAAKGKKPTPADDFETEPSTSLVANPKNHGLLIIHGKTHWFIKEENGKYEQKAFRRML